MGAITMILKIIVPLNETLSNERKRIRELYRDSVWELLNQGRKHAEILETIVSWEAGFNPSQAQDLLNEARVIYGKQKIKDN